jgi:hypothetical protein
MQGLFDVKADRADSNRGPLHYEFATAFSATLGASEVVELDERHPAEG